MLIRFWGTRGSLPSPLNYRAVTAKLRAALVAARGRPLEGAEAIDAFIAELPFSIRGTYGGNSSCVEIVAGGSEDIIFDAGAGLREFVKRRFAQGRSGTQSFQSFLFHPP